MRFLFDPTRRLFSIGYNVSDGRLDNAYYDLLASEARLGSFVAIARGDVPAEHWFSMSRPYSERRRAPRLAELVGHHVRISDAADLPGLSAKHAPG